jgi:hypothetical protein
VDDLLKSPQVFIDTLKGPQPIKRVFGRKLNFLHDALKQAQAAGIGVEAATVALHAEIRDYFGAVVLKEARKNGAHGTPSTGALIINRLVPEADTVKERAVDEVFQALPKFKGRSKFSTWIYAVVRNIVVDAIRAEQKARIAATPPTDPNIAKSGRGGRMMKNLAEDRAITGLDRRIHGDVLKREALKKQQEYNDLFYQQSRNDRRFIRLHVKVHPGQNRKIARVMGWSIQNAYNRKAKFVKLGLLPPIQPDRVKQEYNRKFRKRLQMSNKNRLSL